jgi:hypothetical protein
MPVFSCFPDSDRQAAVARGALTTGAIDFRRGINRRIMPARKETRSRFACSMTCRTDINATADEAECFPWSDPVMISPLDPGD